MIARGIEVRGFDAIWRSEHEGGRSYVRAGQSRIQNYRSRMIN